jgi:diaminopimelate decarboxylase
LPYAGINVKVKLSGIEQHVGGGIIVYTLYITACEGYITVVERMTGEPGCQLSWFCYHGCILNRETLSE